MESVVHIYIVIDLPQFEYIFCTTDDLRGIYARCGAAKQKLVSIWILHNMVICDNK